MKTKSTGRRWKPPRPSTARPGDGRPDGGRVAADLEQESPVQKLRVHATVTGVSVAVAIASLGLCLYGTAQANSLTARVEGSLQSTLVTTSAISAGSVLTKDNCTLMDLPASSRCAAALDGSSWLGGSKSVEGRVARVDLSAGTQICASYLRGERSASTLAGVLDSGYEAVTVSVDAVSGLAGMLKVGDWVHVAAGSQAGLTVVVDRAEVVALDSTLTGNVESYSSVTLELVPADAQELRSVQAAGHSVMLTLISDEDR